MCGDGAWVQLSCWLLAVSMSTACVGAPIRNLWLGDLGRADHFSSLGLLLGHVNQHWIQRGLWNDAPETLWEVSVLSCGSDGQGFSL